ncbi:MAG: prepilin-type N-terminal cleavage/methylation domain-containing protein [Alphaproteobacteria bacterium]|nr:prepilin-type N-terminal cleavage/methylation domain-containing protein [Alphaproteobacteria bacterium]MBV9967168.1 prepilin-type N-terminal cleavage/methylation domain-containing protein [Alphaproteobacteria bacterium]
MRNDTEAEMITSCCRPGSNACGGFTLLEVLIAVAIAGLALIAMFQASSTGLYAADSAARVDEAVERAQSHLAAVGRGSTLIAGESDGDDGGGYHWRLRTQSLAAQEVSSAGQSAPASGLYDVEVMISWRTLGRTRSVVLHTRRIAAVPAPQ